MWINKLARLVERKENFHKGHPTHDEPEAKWKIPDEAFDVQPLKTKSQMKTIRMCMLLIAAVAFLAPAADGEEAATEASVIGQWRFTYQTKVRAYEFREDHTYLGAFPISGKSVSGTWRLDQSKVILTAQGKAGDWGTIRLITGGEAVLVEENYHMTGHKVGEPSKAQ
jgi:hypothetical protein